MKLSVREALQSAREQLSGPHIEDAVFEAQVLLCHCLGKDRSWLYAWPEYELENEPLEQFLSLVNQRIKGAPIAYITGTREFWSMPLQVNKHTLIPRPDTEILVEYVLNNTPESPIKALDLGTGTGAIALALAKEHPRWQISATDISKEALATATQNADKLRLKNIQFFQGHWFEALPSGSEFEVIVSNPPYIRENDEHLKQGDLRYEPISALASGEDGLNDIRQIVKNAHYYLKNNGLLVIEHGYDQAKEVREILRKAGMRDVFSQQDYAGNDRISGAKK